MSPIEQFQADLAKLTDSDRQVVEQLIRALRAMLDSSAISNVLKNQRKLIPQILSCAMCGGDISRVLEPYITALGVQ